MYFVNTTGSIWSGIHELSNHKVVIKVTNQYLHSKSVHYMKGNEIKVHENIVKEKEILKYLTNRPSAPSSIVRYMGFYPRYCYCLHFVMWHGN